MSSNNTNTSSSTSHDPSTSSRHHTDNAEFLSNPTSPCRTSTDQVEWTDEQTAALIEQQRSQNYEYYYQTPGRSRKKFWRSVAENVNNTCGCNYTGQQCQMKFNVLVTNYYDQLLVIANDSRSVRNRLGVVFFDIMNTCFWERLGKNSNYFIFI
ncbi:hypothetical protein RclHR1_24110001 [Rhizophagus clarus]|uniref:Myb-like domain-containing protein n=1 Tax=Rhizophagus clarus TaxID=94130 RepID=A0A2Z6QWY8_9GLOM|nr:hypothetical protein RclHR1_24110001 [Rhizophagus clarus]